MVRTLAKNAFLLILYACGLQAQGGAGGAYLHASGSLSGSLSGTGSTGGLSGDASGFRMPPAPGLGLEGAGELGAAATLGSGWLLGAPQALSSFPMVRAAAALA